MNVFVAWDGDHIGRQVGLAAENNDAEELRRISQAIDHGNEIWKSWILESGGSIISYGGDEGRAEVPADKLEELPKIREKYQGAVNSTVSVGVGMKLSEADRALLAAKLRGGDQILFYTDEAGKEVEAARERHQRTEEDKIADEYLKSEQEPLFKGDVAMNPGAGGFTGASTARGIAAPESPTSQQSDHSEGQVAIDAANAERAPLPEGTHAASDFEEEFHGAAQQQHAKDADDDAAGGQRLEQVKAQVVQVLQQVKGQAAVLQQIQQASPETYATIISMTQAMLALAHELQAPSQPADPGAPPQPVQKSEKLYCTACKDELDEQGHCKVKAHWPKLEKAKLSLPKKTHHPKVVLPVGSQVADRIKVKHVDGSTSWKEMRSGMILSQDPTGHPTSSREPGAR